MERLTTSDPTERRTRSGRSTDQRASTNANGVDGVFHPSWSPDGSLIVFSYYPGASGARASLYVIKADGTGMQLVTENQFNANGADWGVLPAP
jgi:Tol biopolymer transport system component